MWGDQIHINMYKIDLVIISFERLSKNYFWEILKNFEYAPKNNNDIFIPCHYLTLSLFNVDLG